jgi:hypothetical protein
MAWLGGWNYRRLVKVSPTYIDEDLTNFPLYVPYGGADYRFALPNGTTRLSHVDDPSGSVLGMNLSATTGGEFWMYWGNGNAKDDSDASSVLSSYAFASSLYGYTDGMPDLASGYGINAVASPVAMPNGVNLQPGYLTIGASEYSALIGQLAGTTGVSISAVVRSLQRSPYTTGHNRVVIINNTSDVLQGMEVRINNLATLSGYTTGNSDSVRVTASGGVPTDATAFHLAGRLDIEGGNIVSRIYVDGALTASDTDTAGDTVLNFTATDAFTIGVASWSIDATLSHIRVKKTSSTAAERKFEAKNLMSTKNQLRYGPIERRRKKLFSVLFGDE